MTKRLLDYDPLTGVRTWFEYEQSTDKMLITTDQTAELVNEVLDNNAEMRQDADYSKNGIKNDMWHYARIPNGVALEIKKKYGLDMFSAKPDWKSILKIINRDYPMLKVTEKTHA
jgi:hypothetical protein